MDTGPAARTWGEREVWTLFVVLVALLAAACAVLAPASSSPPAPWPPSAPPGTVSVFPTPGTPTASPATSISFHGVAPGKLGTITVSGSRSGDHTGRLLTHSDGRGVSFVPDRPFTAGERVAVHTSLPVRGARAGILTFDIARVPGTEVAPEAVTRRPAAGRAPHLAFLSDPDVTPPPITVDTARNGAAPGYVFLTPNGAGSQPGVLMVDRAGQPVWFREAPRARDFKVQQYRGRPVLAWAESIPSEGEAPPSTGGADAAGSQFEILDDTYHQVALVRAGNGYNANSHDFTITPQGTALLLVYNTVLADATSVGGSVGTPVTEAVVQEIDIPTGAVVFEWHSLGQIPLSDSYQPRPDTSDTTFDYMHVNSVSLDGDEGILVSARHTSTIYEIDRTTGELEWRLGGKDNNFTMGAGTTFAWQHDARRLPTGDLSLFDNGASGVATTQDHSRGLVLHVDPRTRQVRLVRSDASPTGVSSTSQGDYQLLPNGHYFAGWGNRPEYTEFGPGGTVLYDARLPGGDDGAVVNSYRAFKYPWVGHPTSSPSVAVSGGNVVRELDGATEVATWRLMAGPTPASLTPVGAEPRSGFETTLPAAGSGSYVAVQALDRRGNVLGTSPAVPTAPAGASR